MSIPIKTPTELGRAIREERVRQSLLQEDLALAAGTGRRFIIDLEAGKRTVRLGEVLDVLQALGLRVEVESSASARRAHGKP